VPFIPVAVVESNIFGSTDYASEVLADVPVAYWPMYDLSGLPQDQSGNGNHMTAVSGSPIYGLPGPISDTSIEYPSTAFHERTVVSTLTANLTVEMWVYREGNASGDIFRHGTTSGGFELEYTTAGGNFRPNLPGVGVLGSMGTIEPDEWTHVVLQRAASTWTGYANLLVSTPGTASPGTPVGNDRVIGAGATGHRFAHVAFYDSLLDPKRIALHYYTAVGVD
jgi:hypothetical protein